VNAGMAVRPVTSVVSYHERPAMAAAPAAPTELSAAQAISPAADNSAARNDLRLTEHGHAGAPHDSGISRDAIIDPHTSEIVFRVLDAHTGDVIRQVPDQALLRMHAYVRAQAVHAVVEGKDPTAAMIAAMQRIDTTT